MNARSAETSGQLASVLGFLRERGERGATTLEIADHCGTLNVATCASELRHGGHQVLCKRDGTTTGGGKVFRYFLV